MYSHIGASVVIWGVGWRFIRYYEEIVRDYKIVCLADNDPEKQGAVIHGFTVVNIHTILDYNFDFVLVVPHNRHMEIVNFLLGNNISREKIIPFVPEGGHLWTKKNIEPLTNGYIATFNNVRFQLNTAGDFDIMEEIFIQNTYGFHGLAKEYVVFDVGMNVGIASLYFAEISNVKKIYSFEPFPQTYSRALTNISLNKKSISDKITAFNYALSNYTGQKEMTSYNDEHSGWMSIKGDSVATNDGYLIQIRETGKILDELFKQHVDQEIILKIDAEGSEYNIFDSLVKTKLLEKINIIIMESHEGRESEIKNFLTQYGFAFFDNYIGGMGKIGMLKAINLHPAKRR